MTNLLTKSLTKNCSSQSESLLSFSADCVQDLENLQGKCTF